MQNHDFDYYSRRERQERETAERCDDHGARLVHLELANRYSALLREIAPLQVPTSRAAAG